MAEVAEVESTLDYRTVTADMIDDWFVKNLKIRTEQGTIEPFHMKPIQRALTEYVADCWQSDLPCYIITLKARQEGISTWAEAVLFFISRNFHHSRVLVTAHDDEATANIFDMATRYYENLPDEPPTEKSSARAIKFEDTGSEFVIKTAGAKGRVGRSYTLTGFHCSEFDFFPEALKTLQALMQAVPKIGGTIRIIESTADGPMGPMQTVWDRAIEGRNEWKPFFFPWHADGKYTRELSWNDLEKYADKTWVARHLSWIQKGRRDGVGKSTVRRGEPGIIGPIVGYAQGNGRRTEQQDPGSRGESGSGRPSQGEQGEGRPEPGVGGGGYHPLPGRERPGDAGDPATDPGTASASSETGTGSRDNRRLSGSSPWGARRPGDPKVGDLTPKPQFGLEAAFESSLTEYEEADIIEFDLTYEQLNWRRYCLESDCNGDETTMRREYPGRPEEAFEASGGDILDQKVLAQWAKDAKANPPLATIRMTARELPDGKLAVGYEEDDRGGHVEIYEWPDHENGVLDEKSKHRYTMGVDCSQGTSDGDWQIGFVMDVETGGQVAEFRAKMDPDIAVDQIEWLALFYNNAYTGVEISGGYGWAFIRPLHDRALVELYERVAYDRTNKKKVMKPGWDTNVKTRPMLVSETKSMVREQRCVIRSIETINECRLLHEDDSGKIQARNGFHDDGWIGYGIAGILRNEKLGYETSKVKQEQSKNEFLTMLNIRQSQIDRYKEDRFSRIATRSVVKQTFTPLSSPKVDGRRSWI